MSRTRAKMQAAQDKRFTLAPVMEFDPSLFCDKSLPKDAQLVDSLVLALAAIFNDFRGLHWWLQQLRCNPPKSQSTDSPERGEYDGMVWQVVRLQFGVFVELLTLISENERVIESSEFQSLLQDWPNEVRLEWDDLLGLAYGNLAEVSAAGIKLDAHLQTMRAHGVFHYQAKGLAHGYRYFYETMNPDELGYCSLGTSMGGTRFFFADGATLGADQWCQKSRGKGADFQMAKVLHDYLKNINQPIRYLVSRCLIARGAIDQDPGLS